MSSIRGASSSRATRGWPSSSRRRVTPGSKVSARQAPPPAGSESATDMNIASGDRQGYLDAFTRLEREAPPNGRGWLAPIRGAAMDRFAHLGFPTQKEEAWRFTILHALKQMAIVPATQRR